MSGHHALGASSSHRWLYCHGSVEAEKGLPNKSSANADEGSAAHELAELILTGANVKDLIGKPLPDNNAFTVTQEMIDYVEIYTSYVQALPGLHFYEERVSYSDWVEGAYGTADAIAIDAKTKTLYVTDLKYGKGLRVDADENSQLMLYALGAYAENLMFYQIENVKMAIVQPRLDHISEYEMHMGDLLKWGAWVAEQVEIIKAGNAPRTPSEKACQWCKAAATCPALKDYAESAILSQFDELDMPNADTLTDAQLRKALESKKLIVSWLDAVERLVKERLEAGGKFDGFKLVAGRSLRKWGDESEAEQVLADLLKEDAYERKLISPAKAEKALGKTKAKQIQDLIVKPEGAPTLALENDKRQSLSISVDDFD